MPKAVLALLCRVLLLTFSGCFSQQLSALGLGEIAVYSELNQPLHAEIPLTGIMDLNEAEIFVNLASQEVFAKAGLERNWFLTEIGFEHVWEKNHAPYIKLTTSSPVTEPYLNFIIQIHWPAGEILREYTVLFDAPQN